MIVCICKSVSDREIKADIKSGTTSFAGLQCSLGVSTQCGSCACDVKQILQEAQNKQQGCAVELSPQQATSQHQITQVNISPAL